MPATQEQPATQELKVKLPADLLAAVRAAVASGDYATDADVLNDALHDWQQKRAALIARLKHAWQQSTLRAGPYVDGLEALDQLERHFTKLADAQAK